MLQRKYFKHGILLNTFIWLVFLMIPFAFSGDTLLEFFNDVFSKNTMWGHLKLIIMLFGLSLPLSMVIIAMLDFLFGIIYPDQWLSMELLEKNKLHYDNMDIRSGVPKSGYNYTFVFLDKKGKKRRYEGSASQYQALKQGTRVRVRVKANMLIEIDDSHTKVKSLK